MGNIRSICNALDFLGQRYEVSNSRKGLSNADAYILPGVGAFAAAAENLRKLGIIDELQTQILANKKPFLGICLGMQLLGEDSLEMGFSRGLGWIEGKVRKLKPIDQIRLPHVGWNTIEVLEENPLFLNIDKGAHFYFDHIYHLICDEKYAVAKCTYGYPFMAAIQKENILATQFHPEKSQRNGMKLLRNFLNFIDAQ